MWTGLHLFMEELYFLAASIGLAEFNMPRDYWHALPGGMPYVVFNTKGKVEA